VTPVPFADAAEEARDHMRVAIGDEVMDVILGLCLDPR
jgi:hypothetical protein